MAGRDQGKGQSSERKRPNRYYLALCVYQLIEAVGDSRLNLSLHKTETL